MQEQIRIQITQSVCTTLRSQKLTQYEISCSHGSKYENDSFWDTAPCSLIEVGQCFRDVYCLP
jgi:hypothetical protein